MFENISENEKPTATIKPHSIPQPLSESEEQREYPREAVFLKKMGSEDEGQDDNILQKWILKESQKSVQ